MMTGYIMRLTALILIICVGICGSARAEAPLNQERRDTACNPRLPPGFEWYVPQHVMAMHFAERPDPAWDLRAVRKHQILSWIAANFATSRLALASKRRCTLGPWIYSSSRIYLEIFRIGRRSQFACYPAHCASFLSSLLETASVDEVSFSRTVATIVGWMRERDALDLEYPLPSASRASREAFRHILPAGSWEHALVDWSEADFLSVRFEEFSNWFDVQRDRWKRIVRGQELPEPVPEGDPNSTACVQQSDFGVERLDIDSKGWGHRSIIMIKRPFGVIQDDAFPVRRVRIANNTLRNFCRLEPSSPAPMQEPWRELAGRVGCQRLRENTDWLVLHAKEEPAVTSSEMERLARTLAEAIRSDSCRRPGFRLLVVNFLRQP